MGAPHLEKGRIARLRLSIMPHRSAGASCCTCAAFYLALSRGPRYRLQRIQERLRRGSRVLCDFRLHAEPAKKRLGGERIMASEDGRDGGVTNLGQAGAMLASALTEFLTRTLEI